MGRDLVNRYVWLVDTIRRYGRITRRQIDECWQRTDFGNGSAGIPRRTFANYRQGAEELFNIRIACDESTYEYYIEEDKSEGGGSVTDWLLNSAVTNNAITNARDVAGRIFMEDVPSAREFLAPVIEALRGYHPVRFDYLPYSRTIPTRGVVLEPYFLKIFRQRWYITGRHTAENRIKTYALDRMSNLTLEPRTFTPDAAFSPEDYFRHSFGIVFTGGDVKTIVLKVEPRQAKYFRALPLHPSQEEFIHDAYSIFHYRMRVSPDLVQELLSHGPRLEVMEPPELRAMMRAELTEALEKYS